MRLAVARHDALAGEIVSGHAGRLIKSRGEGDSLFAVFARASDGVAAACSLRRALADADGPDVQLRVRMALHTGECDLRDGDYFGGAVNRCARLRSVASGGQVLLSTAAFELARDSLPASVRAVEAGWVRLKDLTRPERVYCLVDPSLPWDMTRIAAPTDTQHNLPRQLTTFIGREREREIVASLLERACLVTLTGPGGCGKTRLAIEVAVDLVAGYADGVWFVELATVRESGEIAPAVASALAVAEEAGKPLLDGITDHLRERRCLLLLDNCEHLVAGAGAMVTRLLHACPALRVLATSREPLAVAGEAAFPVPALSFPTPGATALNRPETGGCYHDGGLDEEGLLAYDSMRLFAERARAAAPSFRLTAANAEGVAAICAALDGVPLAIELAAARVSALTVEQIAERLDDRLRLFTTGNRAALPRQQTLRALVDWSYDLLTRDEQELFKRLAVFAGGFSLDAAERICADRDEGGRLLPETAGDLQRPTLIFHPRDVLGILLRLTDRSLLAVEEAAGPARFRMLETLRQYAWEKLEESARLNILRRRHLAYYHSLAAEAERKLRGRDQPAWLERLEADHANLRAALGFALAPAADQPAAAVADITPAADPVAALEIATGIWWFWHVRGYFTEGRTWLSEALRRDQGSSPLRARALNAAAVLARDQGDFASAREQATESLALKRLSGDRQGVAAALSNLGSMALSQSDYSGAEPHYVESLAIERDLGNRQGVTACLIGLANVARERGDIRRARSLYAESLAIKRDLNDPRGVAASLAGLARVALDAGDFAEARSLADESLAIRRELRDARGEAASLHALAEAELASDPDQAERHARQSIGIRQALGDKLGTAHSLRVLGQVALRRGAHREAARLLAQAMEGCAAVLNRRGLADCIGALGTAAAMAGRAEPAGLLLGAQQALREALGAPLGASESDVRRAAVGKLPPAEYARAFARGLLLSPEEALAGGRELAL